MTDTAKRVNVTLGSMAFQSIEFRKHDEPAPTSNDPKTAYAYEDRGENQLKYDWNGNYNMTQGYPHLTDVEVAGTVRMLRRGDLNHEMVVCMARDRIMALSKEVARLRQRLIDAGYDDQPS